MKTLFCMAVFVATAVAAIAADPLVEFTLQDGSKFVGSAHWMPVKKEYEVSRKTGSGGTAITALTPAQVKGIRVQAPENWKDTMEKVRAGETTQSITALNAIMKDYSMLDYDILAASTLVRIYLRLNRVDDAMRVVDDLMFIRPNAASETEAAPAIWAAWVASKKTARLESSLTDAIQKGPRKVAAQALIMRGDTLMKADGRERERNALKDGYLRAILLFKDVREVQPEALHKAALAFDALQEVHYAERMRQTLLRDYAESDYAKGLR